MGLKLFVRRLQVFAQNFYEVKIDGDISAQFTKLSPLSSSFDKDFANIIKDYAETKFDTITVEYAKTSDEIISLTLDWLNPNKFEVLDKRSSKKHLMSYTQKNSRYLADGKDELKPTFEINAIISAVVPYLNITKEILI